MGKSGGSRVRLPGLESCLCLLLDIWSLANEKILLSLFPGLNNGAEKENIDFRGHCED